MQNKADYYKVFQGVKTKQYWEHLILYFSKVVEATAEQTIVLITKIRDLIADYKMTILTNCLKYTAKI